MYTLKYTYIHPYVIIYLNFLKNKYSETKEVIKCHVRLPRFPRQGDKTRRACPGLCLGKQPIKPGLGVL